jgi:4-hydroxy-tetrahydrodipicolinate reductase
MIEIVVCGAAGRMGRMVLSCAMRLPGFAVRGAVERENHPDLGTDIGVLAGTDKAGVPLTSDLDAALGKCDVLIDFTLHTAAAANATAAARTGRAVVMGTTALSDDELAEVSRAAGRVPIVLAPNMSLGVNLLFSVAGRAAAVLGAGYRVEIEETHHVHKKDAPSGTALRLGRLIAEGAGMDSGSALLHAPEGELGEAPEGRIVVRSFRRGETVGDHTVSFESDGERITFSHHARSREAFAGGALRAAEWVVTRRPRLYDMQDVLGL